MAIHNAIREPSVVMSIQTHHWVIVVIAKIESHMEVAHSVYTFVSY